MPTNTEEPKTEEVKDTADQEGPMLDPNGKSEVVVHTDECTYIAVYSEGSKEDYLGVWIVPNTATNPEDTSIKRLTMVKSVREALAFIGGVLKAEEEKAVSKEKEASPAKAKAAIQKGRTEVKKKAAAKRQTAAKKAPAKRTTTKAV